MDQNKFSYFLHKFDAYDLEELLDLVRDRAELAEEASEALDQILKKKGLTEELILSPAATSTVSDEERSQLLSDQITSSRLLWRGKLATICSVMVAMTVLAPVQQLLKSISIGALWVGLIVGVTFYAGYRFGNSITKSICSDGDASIAAKEKKLWLLFVAMWPIFLFVYVVSHLLFSFSKSAS